jgi:para-nitrobenzyl esterase
MTSRLTAVRRCQVALRWLGVALGVVLVVGTGAVANTAPPVVAAASAPDTAGAADDGQQRPPVLRRTTLGAVEGLDETRSTGTYSWLGIPYAEPPVDDLRWRPPVTHRPWRDVRRTQQVGAGCAQPGRFFSPSPDGPHYDLDVRDGLRTPVGEEDCLTLNVHRPASARRDLPVIVFVHGGSNVVGYSGDPMYDGRTLAKRAGAVVVTVNYRLGAFGWFDLEQPTTGDRRIDLQADSGNFGLLDQIEALRFVRANAARFGGDPRSVTVMGESAGAVNVWALMVSPLSRGLFHRAVPLSGGLQSTPPATAREYADAVGAAAVDEHGATATADTGRLLRSLSADELVQLTLDHGLDATPAVIADGAVVPADPYAALDSARSRDIPVLAGNTFEEGKLFGSVVGAHRPSERDRFTLQYEFDPDRPGDLTVRDLIADAHLPLDGPGGWEEASEGLTAAVFHGIVQRSMDTLVATGNRDVFYYEFGWNEQPAPFDRVYGAVHALDLPFVFGNFGRNVFSYGFSRANRPGRVALSNLMIRSIRTFIRTGSPQHRALGSRWGQWPRSVVFDAGERRAWTCEGRFGGTYGAAASSDPTVACR